MVISDRLSCTYGFTSMIGNVTMGNVTGWPCGMTMCNRESRDDLLSISRSVARASSLSPSIGVSEIVRVASSEQLRARQGKG